MRQQLRGIFGLRAPAPELQRQGVGELRAQQLWLRFSALRPRAGPRGGGPAGLVPLGSD